MTIKINGTTVISNGRKGKFRSVNPGAYTTANRPTGQPGDIIYDSDEKNIFIYDGTDWVSTGGGQVNNLNPAIPPFTSQSGPETTVTNSDGKIEFSLNGTNWSNSITIPPETIYYCDWTDDILSAAQDSKYETGIAVSYPNLSASQTIELEINIDKLPDPFSFTPETDVFALTQLTANTISPLNSINAPTAIWGSSNADNPQIAIADGPWESLPTTINTRYVNQNERVRLRHTTGATPSFDYSTTLNIGYGDGAGEFETSNFVTQTSAAYIDAPVFTTPTEGSNEDINTIVAQLEPISGQAFGTHESTDWQLANDAGFTDIVEQSNGNQTSLTTYNFSQPSNDTDRTLYIRARFNGSSGLSSDYSDTISFNAQKRYTWKISLFTRAGDGARGDDGEGGTANGGGGRRMFTILETVSSMALPTGSISSTINAASGGPFGGGGGAGGNASAQYFEGTLINVAGGGGGGGTNGINAPGGGNIQNSNSTLSNGGTATPNGGGGGGGTPGGAGSNNSFGTSGGSYALSDGSVINGWRVSSSGNSSGTASQNSVQLNRKYKSNPYEQVGEQLNYSGTVENLIGTSL